MQRLRGSKAPAGAFSFGRFHSCQTNKSPGIAAGALSYLERGFFSNYDAGVVEPPGVFEPPPGVVPGVGAGAGEVAGGVVEGAGLLAPGVGLFAGAGASSFLLQALSDTASTDAIIKVLLIIFGLL